MSRFLVILSVCFLAVLKSEAHDTLDTTPWAFIAAIGFTDTQQMQGSQGLTNLKRLALHRDLYITENTRYGILFGSQDGNSGRPTFTQAQVNALGVGTIIATTKTGYDLLGEVASKIYDRDDLWGYIKLGCMWRQLFFNTDRLPVLNRASPELQIGLSKSITPFVRIGLAYQGIYAEKMILTINGNGTGSINSIPTQHGGLLTIYSTL